MMEKKKFRQLRPVFQVVYDRWRLLRGGMSSGPDWETLPKLLPLRQTARLLGVHPNTLRLWDQRGQLRSVRIGTRQDRRYERERVQELWLQSHASRAELFVQRWIERRAAVATWRRRSLRPLGASALGLSMLWGIGVLQLARADQPQVLGRSVAPASCTGWRDARQALLTDRPNADSAWSEKSATYDSDEHLVAGTDGTSAGSLDTPLPTITCSSFTAGLPANATPTTAQVRASLRTAGPANSTASFSVQYMLDSQNWVTGDTVPAYREENGIIQFDLPTPTRNDLSRLQVRIVPDVEPGTSGVRAALDGVEVVVRYSVPIDETSRLVKETKRQLDPLVQFSQSLYEPSQQPVVTIPKQQVKKFLYFFTVGKVDWNLDTVELRDGSESDFTPQYSMQDVVERESTVTKLNLTTTYLHPGKYTVRVRMSNTTGGVAMVERTFLWGVMALNFVRPSPVVGEQERVALGILDDNGRTICDADVTAKVTDPRGRSTTYTTAKGSIVRSAVCVDKGVTNTPDYSFSFTPKIAGTYNIALIAKTKFGDRVLKENLLVNSGQEFDVQRSDYPTRIYPPADYNVTISVTPHRDFRGVVTEWVPGDFAVSKVLPLGSIGAVTDTTAPRRIDWAVDWRAEETYQLHYTFKAPDISPALFLTGPLTIAANALQGNIYTEPRQWQIASDSIAVSNGYVPSSGTLATGNASNRLAATAASGAGVNTGSYLGTLADDNYHWTIAGTNTASATNIDMQLNVDGVQLNGANKIIIQTEIDTDAAIAARVQICDWDDASSAGNFDSAEDSNCNDGTVDSNGAGWRTINSQFADNTDITISTITSGAPFTWSIRDGYFTTGATGGTALSTPLANFVKSGTNQVKIRYYSATQTSTAIDVDYLRVIPIIDSIYEASEFTQITGGTPAGTYVNTNVFVNTSAAMNNFTSSDAIYLAVPGTAGAISDFYLSYKNVQTYTGANTIYVRADYSCSTTGINIKPKIYNFNTTSWQDLTTGTIACSATDANGAWAMNNVTISNYISNGEIRIGWYGSANNTLSIRLDFQYIMIGTTNSDSAQCEITFGTGTATNCTNTRDIDLTGTTNNFSNPAQDESNTFGTDFYPLDNDGDATVEEAAASNMNFSVTRPSGSKIVNTHYAGRFDAGSPNTTTALSVQMGIRDYTGTPTSTSGTGSWAAVGASDAAQASGNTYTLTDSVTAWAANLYGAMDNPEDRIDTINNLMNIRLRTSASGATGNNVTVVWDFAMISIAWINTTEHPSTRYQFVPTGGATVTAGAAPNRLAATANTVQGVNTAQGTAGWKATLANDNYHWSVPGAGASGVNFYLDTNYVQMNGANKFIIQTEFDLDTTLPSPMIQICDWDDANSAGNFDSAEDTQCNDGVVDGSGAGWRSLNSVNASNAEIIFSNATPAGFLQWQIYDGYWSTGTAGGTSLSTPLTNFVDTGNSNRVRIRWYATTNHSSNTDIDYLWVTPVVDSMYQAAGFTQITGGTPVGTYASTRIVGNTTSGQQSTATTNAAGDAIYLSVPGTAGAISDFYYTFKDIKLYNGMNTIYVRSEYSCSTTGINIKPKIYNFKTGAWADLTSATIACSATDAMGTWAVNNVTITDYIQNGELRVGWYGSANNTLSIRVDDIFVILGSTNSDTAQCAITFGTGTATDCVNTRTIDLNNTVSSFGVTAADESNTFGNDYIAQDNDADANLEEANASNIGMTVGLPSNAFPVGGHFAGRFAAGYPNTGAGNVNQLGMRNYAGVPTSTTGVGGWDAIGATATAGASAPDSYTHTDSLSVLAANIYGTMNNPNMQVDTANDLMNLRLRTTTGGASGNNVVAQWDFAFVSVMWTESTGITVSGNVYSNETPTFMDCTTPKTVRLKINGSGNYSGSCTGASGSYSVSNVPVPYAGATITVYLDGATEKGSITTVSADGTSAISNLHLYQDVVAIANQGAGATSNDNMRMYDSGGDSDVQYTVAGAAAGPAITVASGDELHVVASTTYTAGGAIVTNATGGLLHVLGTATIDTGTNTIGTDISVGTNGTLNINANTTVTGGDITTTGSATVTTTSGTPIVSLNSGGSIGGGTNALTFYTLLANSGTTTVTSDIITNSTFNVGSTATLTGSTNITVKGNFWGQGTVTLTGGTVNQQVSANRGFGSVSPGTSDWTFNNLTFSNSDPTNARTISVQDGTGQIIVNGTLQIGNSGDAQNTTFDNETANDRILNTNGAVNITSKGILLASSTQSFTVAGDWTNSGTFTANSGTVTFDGTSQQAVSGTLTGASGKFNTLVVTNSFGDASTTWSVTFAGSAETAGTFTATMANTKLRFNAGSTYTFQNISFNGQATGTRVYLRSSSNGSAWNLAVAGTRSVSNTNVRDSDATLSGTAIDASDGTNVDGTGNTNWNFSSGISISGFIYTNDASTALDCSTGGSRTVAVKVNGSGTRTGTCSLDTGAFTITSVTVGAAGDVLTVFISGASEKAATVTLAADNSSNISGLPLRTSRLVVSHESAGPVTNNATTGIGRFDKDDDATNLFFTANSNNLSVDANYKLVVNGGKTYTPGGTVTTTAASTAGNVDGDVLIQSTAVMDVGSNAVSVGGDFTNSGTYTKSSGQTTTMTATGTGFTFTSGGTTMQNLTFNGSGGGWTNSGALTLAENFTGTAGGFTQANSTTITVNGTSFSLANGFTWTKATSGANLILENATGLSFADNNTTKQNLGAVQIGASPGTTTLTTDMSADSVTIPTGDTFNTKGYDVTTTGSLDCQGTCTLNLTDTAPSNEGDGTTMTIGGDWTTSSTSTFTAHTSTVIMNGTGSKTITNAGGAFNHLQTNNTGTYTVGGGITDDFERASLGGNWTGRQGTPTISGSSDYGGSAAGDNLAAYTGATFGGDQYAEGTISAFSAGNETQICVRVSPSGAVSYYCMTSDGTLLDINEYFNGGWSGQVASGTVYPAVGDRMRLEAQGSTLRGYINGQLVITGTDTSTSTGYPGLNVWAGGTPTSTIEDFTAGNLLQTAGDITVTQGTLAIGANSAQIDGGDISVSGTLTQSSNGVTLMTATGSVGGGTTTFGDLNVGTLSSTITTTAGGNFSAARLLIPVSSGTNTFDASTRTVTLVGSGTGANRPFVVGTSEVLTEGSSTFVFAGTLDTSIWPETFNNLTIAPTGGSNPAYIFDPDETADPTNVSGTFIIGDGSNAVTVNGGVFSALTVTGDATINASGTFVTSDTSTTNFGGSYTNSGTFTDSGGGVNFTATTSGKTLNGSMTGANKFIGVNFNGSGGVWTTSAALEADTLTMSAGTLAGTNNVTVNTQANGTAGVISRTGGTFTQRPTGSQNFGPTTASTNWIFNDLTFGNAHAATGLTITKQSCSTCSVTVNGALSVGKSGDTAATTLNAGDATWTLAGAVATPLVLLGSPAGTLTTATSTIAYTGVYGSGNVNVTAATYYNLTTNPSSAETYDVATGFTISNTLDVGSNGTLSIASGQTVTHSGATLTLNGTISGAGRYTYQSATALPATGTISSILRMDTTNAASQSITCSGGGRTLGGAVELYSNNAAARTITLCGTASHILNITGAVSVNAANTGGLTIEGNTYDPAVNVTGNFAGGTAGGGTETVSMGSGTWTMSGDVNFTNTTVSNTTGGTITMDGTGGKTFSGNGQSFNNLTFSPSGTNTINIRNSTVVLGGALTVGANTTLDTDQVINMNTTSCSISLNAAGTMTGTGSVWYDCDGNTFPTTGTFSVSNLWFIAYYGNMTVPARTYGGTGLFRLYNNSGTSRTIYLGAGTLNVSAPMNIYSGSGANTTIDASNGGANNPTVNVTGDLTVTATAAETRTLITGTGTWTMGGNVNLTNASTFTPTSGNTIVMTGSSKTLTSAGFSLYNFTQSGGSTTMSGTTTLDNDLTVTSGTLTAPSSGALNVAGDFVNDGTFAHNNSTLTLNGTTSTTLDTGCVTVTSCTNEDLYSVVINKTAGAGANDDVTLTSTGVRVANTLTVTAGELVQGALNVQVDTGGSVSVGASGIWTNISTGDLYLGGGFSNAGAVTFSSSNAAQCTDVADDIVIDSTQDNTIRTWSGAGTYTMRNINVDDMSDGGITITIYTSTKSGDTDWTVGACGIDVSGTIYQSGNEGSVYDCSGGNTVNLRVATNGGSNVNGQCTAANGTFTVSAVNDPGAADIPMAVFIDSGDSTKATTVTLSSAGATNITGLTLIMDRLVVTQESATALTNSHLSTADNASAGIRYSVSAGNLTVESGMELHVLSGKTFTPGGTVTTTATGTAAGAAGDLHIAGTLTMGTNALTVGGDYNNVGTYNKTNTQTTTLAATGTGFTITPGTGALNNLTVSGDAGGNGTYTLSGADLTVDGTLTVNSGDTLAIDTSRTLTNTGATDTNNDGTISGAGTLTYTNASGGPDSDANSTGTYSTTVRFDTTSGNVAATTFDARTYSGKVELYSNSTSSRTITMASGTYTLSGSSAHFNPIAANSADLIIAGDTNNPTVTIGGDLDFTGSGSGFEVVAAGTGTWTVSGNVDFTNGFYGPSVATLVPIALDTAQRDAFTDPLASCAPPTDTYSCLGTGVSYGTTLVGDCINNNENQHQYIDRGYLVYNPTSLSDTATILSANVGVNVSATYSYAVGVARSTTDDIETLNCTTSGGRYAALNNSTYGSVTLSSATNVMIPLGTTGTADIQSRLTGSTARLTVGLQSSTTDTSMGAVSTLVNTRPALYASYIDGGSPTLTMNGTSKTLTTAGNALYNLNLSGTITLANETHYIGGDLNMTGGDVTPGSSAVYLTGVGKTLTAPVAGDTLYAVTIDPPSAGTITLAAGGGDLTVTNVLTVASSDTLSLGSGRTLSHTYGTNTVLLGTISGSGTLRYTDVSGGPGTGGTLSAAVQFDASAANITSGTLDARTYGGAVEFYANSGTAKTITAPTGTFVYSGAVTLTSAGAGSTKLELNTNDPTSTVTGTLTIGTGSELSANSANALNVNGNYANNGTFTDNSGTVTLAGSSQQTVSGTMTGSSDFNNVTITNASGSDPESSPSVIFASAASTAGTFTATTANTKLRFNAGSTYTFVNVTLNGQATGTRVYARSSTNSTQWNLTSTGTQTVSNTDVRDSNACGGDTIDASDGTNNDATNNSCWNINTISLTISDTTIGFGSCSSGGARYATGDTLGASADSADAHTLSVATNARSGYSLSVAGSTLTATVGTISAIGGSAQPSSVGSEQYGLRAIKNSGTGTVSSPFDTANWAFTAGSTQAVASYAGSSSSYSAVYGIRYICNVSGITEAGNYATDMTYILTSTF